MKTRAIMSGVVIAGLSFGTFSATTATAASTPSDTEFFFDLSKGAELVETMNGEAVELVSPAASDTARSTETASGSHAILRTQSGATALAATEMLDWEQPILAVTGAGFVDLSWGAHPTDAPYQVSANSVSVEQTDENYHRLELPAGLHDITVSGTREIPEEEWTEEQRQEFESVGIRPRTGDNWYLSIEVPSSSHEAELKEVASAATARAAAVTSVQIKIRAFIPDARIEAPWPLSEGCETPHFKGDNRSWSASSGTHRMQYTVTWTWENGVLKTLQSGKSVGPTVAYFKNANGTETAETRFAGTSDMWHAVGQTATHQGADINFQGADPFCDPVGDIGKISGRFGTSVSPTLGYYLEGYHLPVPSYEIYFIKTSPAGTVTTNAYRLANKGFQCLTVWACRTQYVTYGTNPAG